MHVCSSSSVEIATIMAQHILQLQHTNVQQLLSYQDKDGMTALMYTCKRGLLAAIPLCKILLTYGSNCALLRRNKKGETALLIACRSYSYALVKLLFSFNGVIEINIKDNDGNSPLMCAISKGYRDMVKLLLDNGALECILYKDKQGKTCLMEACLKSDHLILQLLLDSCHNAGIYVDVNDCDMHGKTLFMYAIDGEIPLTIIQSMLERIDNIHRMDNHGYTVFSYACKHNNLVLMKLLIDKGSNDYQQYLSSGELRMSDLMRACKETQSSNTAIYLINNNLSIISAKDNNGKTALYYAMSKDDLSSDVIELLLEYELRNTKNNKSNIAVNNNTRIPTTMTTTTTIRNSAVCDIIWNRLLTNKLFKLDNNFNHFLQLLEIAYSLNNNGLQPTQLQGNCIYNILIKLMNKYSNRKDFIHDEQNHDIFLRGIELLSRDTKQLPMKLEFPTTTANIWIQFEYDGMKLGHKMFYLSTTLKVSTMSNIIISICMSLVIFHCIDGIHICSMAI